MYEAHEHLDCIPREVAEQVREALEHAPEKHPEGPDEAIYRYWYDGYREVALTALGKALKGDA